MKSFPVIILSLSLFLLSSFLVDASATSLPDVTNKTVVLSLAELAANAYLYPDLRNTATWRNSTNVWKYLFSYGWEIDGLRGHVFEHVRDQIITLSVKGTSLNSAKDKESANMICSCNCCFSNCTRQCDRERLLEGLPNMYLSLLVIAYDDLRKTYPQHQFWFTGHSMGAVIAALAGMELCHPVVAFSSPGEQLFADRIGLAHACHTGNPSIYHIGYYRDPIYVGNCGWLCYMAGYRMESKCHHGYECVYNDSIDEDASLTLQGAAIELQENWNVQSRRSLGSGMIYTHTIKFLIDKVITPSYDVPKCKRVEHCQETCAVDGCENAGTGTLSFTSSFFV